MAGVNVQGLNVNQGSLVRKDLLSVSRKVVGIR